MRGVGGAPIKTKYGWLVFYHAMEPDEPNRYKIWAMILDKKDPTKILTVQRSQSWSRTLFMKMKAINLA